jgi:uncharacterized protein (DUF924 family)
MWGATPCIKVDPRPGLDLPADAGGHLDYSIAARGRQSLKAHDDAFGKSGEHMNERNAPATMSAENVLAFWTAAGSGRWFERDEAFDAAIRERFAATYEAAAAGLLSAWENSPQGALALVIVLDQFPRNMFRHSARSYATDPLARTVAQKAIDRGFDRQVAMPERSFLYLPFEHSEELADQERAVALFRATGDADLLKWAELHADVIWRFGRFPHRNAVLGRATTPAEQAFLDAGGFSG